MFLEQLIDVLGAGIVPAGAQEYQFSFVLPLDLPDTYKNYHGHIEYSIKANVDIPWAPDYDDKVDIIVKTPLDLNTIRNLRPGPVQYEEEKVPASLFRSSGPITMSVVMDREAFVLGETAKIKVQIKNQSKDRVDCVRVKIASKIITKTKLPREDKKYNKEVIIQTNDSGVDIDDERAYDMALELPELTFVPNFTSSVLFEHIVHLTVEAVISGLHRNLKVKTPIYLGHIPLSQRNGCRRKSAAGTSSENKSSGTQRDGFPALAKSQESKTQFKGNDDLPTDDPPSYEDTMRWNSDPK